MVLLGFDWWWFNFFDCFELVDRLIERWLLDCFGRGEEVWCLSKYWVIVFNVEDNLII